MYGQVSIKIKQVCRQFRVSTANGNARSIKEELVEAFIKISIFQILQILIHLFTDNLHEYESGTATPVIKDRLEAHVHFWENIRAPDKFCSS